MPLSLGLSHDWQGLLVKGVCPRVPRCYLIRGAEGRGIGTWAPTLVPHATSQEHFEQLLVDKCHLVKLYIQ